MGTRDVGPPVAVDPDEVARQAVIAAATSPAAPAVGHPVAQTLHDIAARIDRGEISVAAFGEPLTPEATLAVVLAELLKRPR